MWPQREETSFFSCTCAFELLNFGLFPFFVPSLQEGSLLFKPVQHTSPHPAHVLQWSVTPFSALFLPWQARQWRKALFFLSFDFILFPWYLHCCAGLFDGAAPSLQADNWYCLRPGNLPFPYSFSITSNGTSWALFHFFPVGEGKETRHRLSHWTQKV